ncbi:MAG: PPC domain-containing DNA-binding protein [Patescibacteria group bacterium]
MRSQETTSGYLLVLERGEELIEALTGFCTTQGIQHAVFQGIGAVEQIEIGYYNRESQHYSFRKEEGVFEVASLHGNVALVDGKPFLHAHAVLSRCDETLECIGAHIQAASVAVTLEIHMTVFTTPISRELDESIGLKLLRADSSHL